ncbi:translation initiation factor 2 [Bosea vaviloviae]|uniref:Translation initiation factor 2 n=2 Tax=Bosea vaviloviae TaxID=1526658 RepID=A0A0N1FK14_9HYPH|nr:translation initiation factor 2 [Bosea vaviloviae]
MRILMTIAVALSVSACGTVTRGSNEDVTFNSEPPGAKVLTSTGLVCNATPCTFPISRKQEFIATFELPGHHSQQVAVKTEVSGGGAAGMAGNILVGGVVGIVVDASTGATLDHSPNPVFVTMSPVQSPKRAAKPRRSRNKASASQV